MTASQSQPKTRPLSHRGDINAQINVWKFQAKDKDGALVEFAPGNTWCVMKGPVSREGLLESANGLLYNARVEHCTNGKEDPEFQVILESITPITRSDAGLGKLAMPGLVPLTLGVGASYPELDE